MVRARNRLSSIPDWDLGLDYYWRTLLCYLTRVQTANFGTVPIFHCKPYKTERVPVARGKAVFAFQHNANGWQHETGGQIYNYFLRSGEYFVSFFFSFVLLKFEKVSN